MNIDFTRMSDDARKSLALARQQAIRLSHDFIGTEHLLLALLDGQFARIRSYLESWRISTEDVASKLNATVQPSSDSSANPQLPFTPHIGRALELSMEEAGFLRFEPASVSIVLRVVLFTFPHVKPLVNEKFMSDRAMPPAL